MTRLSELVFVGLLAQQPDEQFAERYDTAVGHLEAGKASSSRESYQRCADIFIELYNQYEGVERADELLFNAAVCSELAGAIGMAIQIRTSLLDRHPHSDVAEPTLAALAWSYESTAYYEHAAERYEQYAAQYPESKDTPGALQNAYLFRVGLGQTDAALRDLDDYERIYQRKDPQTAARIFWARRELLDTAKQQRDHALAYIERYGRAGSVDRWIVAEAVIAQIDWRSSCAEPLLFDSCITIESGKHPRVTVHARKRKLAAEAQARFERILAAIRKSSIAIPEYEYDRQTSFVDAWAMAIVYQVDADYESVLRLDPPNDRDAARKLELADELADRYAAVTVAPSPHWQAVAAARVGLLYESFADQLARREPLAARAQPLREQAMQAWLQCLVRATQHEYFDEFTRLCELRLAALEPVRHPATHELFGEPGRPPTRMRTVGVLPAPDLP